MGDDKIISIKINKDSALDWTLIEGLEQLVRDIKSGNINFTKGVLCLQHDYELEDKRYQDTSYRLIGMSTLKAVGLLEVIKSDLIYEWNKSAGDEE